MAFEASNDPVGLREAFLSKKVILNFFPCRSEPERTYLFLGGIDARGGRKLITHTHMRQLL